MVKVQSVVTERGFMARPNQLHQVDVCRHDASQIWKRQNHRAKTPEFTTVYRLKPDLTGEARNRWPPR